MTEKRLKYRLDELQDLLSRFFAGGDSKFHTWVCLTSLKLILFNSKSEIGLKSDDSLTEAEFKKVKDKGENIRLKINVCS